MEEETHLVPYTKSMKKQSEAAQNPNSKKRKASDVDLTNSAYFKICSIVRQLRTQFIEVLRTPDFRNCQAAHEIRKRMMLVMDLYKHMQIEGRQLQKPEVSAPQPLSSERKPKTGHLDGPQKKKPQEEHPQNKLPEKSVDSISLGKKEDVDLRPQGTYIVGGSVSGWNFITFVNRRPPVYYGVTKESFRLCHALHTGV